MHFPQNDVFLVSIPPTLFVHGWEHSIRAKIKNTSKFSSTGSHNSSHTLPCCQQDQHNTSNTARCGSLLSFGRVTPQMTLGSHVDANNVLCRLSAVLSDASSGGGGIEVRQGCSK